MFLVMVMVMVRAMVVIKEKVSIVKTKLFFFFLMERISGLLFVDLVYIGFLITSKYRLRESGVLI